MLGISCFRVHIWARPKRLHQAPSGSIRLHQAPSGSIPLLKHKSWLHHLVEQWAWQADFIRKILEPYQDQGGQNLLFSIFFLKYKQKLALSLGRLISLASWFHIHNFGTLSWPKGAESNLFCNFWTINKSWLHHLADWTAWPVNYKCKILEPYHDQGGWILQKRVDSTPLVIQNFAYKISWPSQWICQVMEPTFVYSSEVTKKGRFCHPWAW